MLYCYMELIMTDWLTDCIIVIMSGGGATQEDYEEAELGAFDEESSLAGQHGDERTEIILAATFLLIVILSFIA